MRVGRRVVTLFPLIFILNYCSAKYFIAAPNLLRVGVEETVSVTIFDVGGQVNVKIFLQDYPHRKKTFSRDEGNFEKDKPGILKVKVNANDLSDQKSLDKQYVYLTATSSSPGSNFRNEMKILVSYRNAMVFIQTDKPIYTPGQAVHLRVVPLDLDLKASLKNVTIEIMNPQGICVDKWRNLNPTEGFFSRKKDLAKNTLLGNWTVNALYGHGLVQNTSVQFEVKEYILPKFSVKVNGPPYILETDKIIEIKVTSKYTYGKSVTGTAQLSLAVLDASGKTQRFSTSFLELRNGEANNVINTDLLKKHPSKLWFPEGKRLFIEAKVVEKATGKQEKVLDDTIYFTKCPFKISFKRTPKFFKPGVPYEIKVDVSYVNGKPAGGIEIKIEAKTDTNAVVHEHQQANRKVNTDITDELGRGSFTLDIPKTFAIKYLAINVSTQTKISSEQSFRPTMYSSPGNNYLSIRAPKSKVGKSLNADAFVLSTGDPRSLMYLVIARGKVVASGTKVRKLGVVTTIRLQVTPAMSPQARLIAYYIVRNEVVVDSTIIEVGQSFPNQVDFNRKNEPPKDPGEPYIFKIKADPYSRVGILAVDQSVYLLRNDKQLTSDTVFKRVKSHDLGCGPGAGQNNKDVLTRSGLAVMTDYNLKTDTRTDYHCSVASRKRRSIDLPHQKKCCALGQVVDPRSCLVRGKEFSKNVPASLHPIDNCVVKFYQCCKRKFETSSRGRSNDNDLPPDLLDNLKFENVQIRSYFPETWLYEDEKAGKNGTVEFRVTIPDTITTWVMQAISVSNSTGFGLAPPVYLTAFKPFFVTLNMPYSAQRGEQVSITATVFNYQRNKGHNILEVRLILQGSKDFCSHVEPNERRTIYKLQVKAKDAVSVSFPIVPITTGEIPIRVLAASQYIVDGYERSLKVFPEGMQKRKAYSLLLDPHDILRDPQAPKPAKPTTPSAYKTGSKGAGEQKNSLLLRTPDSTVPGSQSAQLFLMGNLIGPVVTNVIEGRKLTTFIRLPTGCGEQNMVNLAPNVFVLQYLRTTKQVTPQIETNAFNFIRSGYQNQLNYRRSDHSFSASGNGRPGSTWLTAFVIKTFCAAEKLGGVEIDEEVICSAMRWLSSIQRSDGVIPERAPISNTYLDGNMNGDLAVTAYVATALIECKCSSYNIKPTMTKVVKFLETKRLNISHVYVKALVAFALTLASSHQRFAANNELLLAAHYDAEKNTRYWTDGGSASNVETTAYALLTQMLLNRVRYSGPIVVWLTEQRKGGGGFFSTQDTCVALQALAAYSAAVGGDPLDLQVEITSSQDGDYKKTLRVDKGNALVQQRLDISSLIDGDIFITTKGTGIAQLQVETRYNTPPSELETCQFDLTVETVEDVNKLLQKDQIVIGKPKKSKHPKKQRKKCKKGRTQKCKRKGKDKGKGKGSGKKQKRPKNKKVPKLQAHQPVSNIISFKVCTRYKRVGGTTGMSIIDVGILTGFRPVEETLKKLRDNVKPGISLYEISDRHVVLYIDKIPHNRSLCFTLEMTRDYEVGLVQPVPVTVYDYYEPDNKCTAYYGPKPDSLLKLALCNENRCKCTLDRCTSCNPSDVVQTVVDKVCRKYDYAIKGKVRSIDEKDQWLYIKIEVKKIIKEGKRKLVKNKRFQFAKKAACDCPKITADTVDADFLIMGKDQGIQGDKIVMDNEVFVKAWPSSGTGARFFKKFRRKIAKKDACS